MNGRIVRRALAPGFALALALAGGGQAIADAEAYEMIL